MKNYTLVFFIALLFFIATSAKANDTLVRFGQNLPTAGAWKYKGGGTNLDAVLWKDLAYAEPGWLTGNAALGFGTNPPVRNTAIPEDASTGGGGVPAARYPTMYFRKQVTIPNPALYINFQIRAQFDDGIVIWVNGVEAFRNNIAASPTYATLATGAIGGNGATIFNTTVSNGLFVPGNNIIAVEVHQNSLTSTDLFFDMELIGMTSVPPSPFILRPFTQRYNNASVKGNIVYLANSIVSTQGIGAGSPGTGELPPSGTTTNGAAGINIDVDNTTTTIIPYATSWKFLDNNTQPVNWNGVSFVDAAWATGTITAANRDIGYGDGDEDVCVAYGANYGACPVSPACNPTPGGCNNKFVTTLLRKQFTVTGLTNYSGFQLNVHRDDGVVIYVNGTEVARSNMPAGPVTSTTLALTSVDGANEDTVININTAAFVEGANTIAVEVHQQAVTSSDMSFRMEMTGINTQQTFNSSTSDLTLSILPACSQVLFAGLYWGAGEGSGVGSTAWITGNSSCKLKIPGAGSYITVNSTQNDYWNSSLIPGYVHTGYQCYANITSLINSTNANGTYAVADVLSPLGLTDAYGGWTIVIAYANASLAPRNLSVFDGTAIVKSGSGNVDVPITGFLTPPTGPVSCELGAVVFDGDRVSADAYAFQQNGAPGFYDLTPNATANPGDMWNSVIAYKGNVVTTRNPAFQNTLGYDANIIDLPNAANAQLSNSQTGATVRFSSPSENYIVQVLTTSISQYTPIFSFDKTATDISGGALTYGDSLRYQVNYNNVGNDASTNTTVIDNIPVGTTYIPGTLTINGVIKTDAAGDDEADYDMVNNRVVFRLGTGATASAGGTLTSGSNGNVRFNVLVANSCSVLGCVGNISNSARIVFTGLTSGLAESDSSGVNTAGCIVRGPVINTASGSCYVPKDTLITSSCPVITVQLPWRRYAGYVFYGAQPFISGNRIDPTLTVTTTHTYWAYFNNGSGCSDTVRVSVVINSCPDIDDDNDGIPDYVEFNNPVALQDHNSNGIPNWKDPVYPGYTDNDADGVNDNFDYGADADNDGIPNFYDINFPGFTDTNGDGVNDNADKDRDGIPNQYDLDSDNDGIPDVAEAYGVDTNGDGKIDNYTDTDNDGLSQNVDINNTGVAGSGNGLGAPDFDTDGIANYLDRDSDNDGIPDVVEASGADTNNDGLVDGYTDSESDGFTDSMDGDVGNDGTAENTAAALLLSGTDGDNNGRADNWPNKNLDRDQRPNAYDVDSDGDGIIDVIEAGLPDANLNGIIDGTININGWSATVAAMGAINLRNTDGAGNPDYLDIDSDNDGIPDNIEGLSTIGYLLPSITDTDGDGLVNTYDNVAGFSGSGIFVYDHDGDGIPDYRDLDTDGDGQLDIVEGNDFNLNGMTDDIVTLTGLDTDGDGLDNRFDSLASVTNIKGTSYRMGTGGTFAGDGTPGSSTTVQKKIPAQADRDWRDVGSVLPVQFLGFSGLPQNAMVLLNWKILTVKEVDHFEIERSIDNSKYDKVGIVSDAVKINEPQSFGYNDDIAGISNDIIYYRLKVNGTAGEIKYSNVLVVRKNQLKTPVTIMPNPAQDYITVSFFVQKESVITIRLVDNLGKTVLRQTHKAGKGNNIFQLNSLAKYSSGVYTVQVFVNDDIVTQKLIVQE